jgi:hypothetical protein
VRADVGATSGCRGRGERSRSATASR